MFGYYKDLFDFWQEFVIDLKKTEVGMELSGPSFCQIKDGLPCNKWMITAFEKTPKGTKYDIYLFKTKKDAETYFLFLQQCIGVADLKKKISNPRTFEWEKREYREFLHSLDLTVLEKAAESIFFEKDYKFYPAR